MGIRERVTDWQCACQRMQWKNLCPVSQDVSITIPGSWLTGLRFLLAVALTEMPRS